MQIFEKAQLNYFLLHVDLYANYLFQSSKPVLEEFSELVETVAYIGVNMKYFIIVGQNCDS